MKCMQLIYLQPIISFLKTLFSNVLAFISCFTLKLDFPTFQTSLDQMSEDLLTDFSSRMKSDPRLQSMYTERSKLPVFTKRNEIMSMINENSVSIIKGNTGSGKTTQVHIMYTECVSCTRTLDALFSNAAYRTRNPKLEFCMDVQIGFSLTSNKLS